MADEVDKMGFGPPRQWKGWKLNKDNEWEISIRGTTFISHWHLNANGDYVRPLGDSASPAMQRTDGSIYSSQFNPRGVNYQCFVANSAFENKDHPAVDSLRRYKDEVLSKSPVGRAFVSAYYGGLGQSGARVLDSFPALKPAVRTGIEKLVAHVIEPSLQAKQDMDRPYK